MRRLLIIFILLTNLSWAQDIKVVEKVRPKPFAISHNIVFIVDASSTINKYPEIAKKFNKSWDIIVNQFASDELYFRTYIFHDAWRERRTKWIDAGGPQGLRQFARAKKWIKANTGTFSWGTKTLRMAMRERNPLDKNPGTNRRLTIILLTDGGFTEASDGGTSPDIILKSTLAKHSYARTGSFEVYDRLIAQEQKSRVNRGLEPATIVAIGIENTLADEKYGTGVKRPDSECQTWLSKVGKKYHGGYFLVRKEKTRAGKKVS